MVQFLIYNFAEHNGTAITNHGGSGYAGTANRDMWVLRNGRGTYGPFGSSDRITIADGTYQQTITSHSWEFWYYVNGRGANGTYEHLWDDNYGGLIIQMQNTPPWTLTVYRRTNASDAVYWCFETIDFQPGHDYYVQIAGNFGTNPQNTNLNSVHVHIGIDGAAPTHYPSHVLDFYKGAGSAWFPHDANLPTLGNSPTGQNGNNASVVFIRVREYNEAINWDVAGDWQADVVGSLESTYLTMEADDYSPTIGQTVNFVTTVKDSSGNGVAGVTVHIGYFLYYENDDNAWVDLYSADTIGDGTQSFGMSFDSAGHRYFNTEFLGDSSYQPSISSDININVTTEEIDQSINLHVFNSGQTGALSPTVSTGIPTSVITGGQFAAITPVVTIDDNMVVHVYGTIDSNLEVLPASMGIGFEIAAEMIRYNPYPLCQESNCIIKFTNWPPFGTTIINEGIAGSELNGIAVDNDYVMQATGATSFNFDDANDQITISASQPPINLFQPFTRVGTAPILTKPVAVNELIWASVIRTDTLIPVDSLMKYYLYASPHNESGTGVYLYGSNSLDGPWELYSGTPIVAKEIVTDATHISSPFIIWNPDTSKFHLYFHASRTYGDVTNQETFLATSSDGITFTLSGSTPVIPVGTHPAWDDVATSYACVLKDGATWRLIYTGQGAAGAHIGYATSADGITWAKQGQLTLAGESDEEVGMLMNVGGVYYIFESRLADTYLWTSTDLSTWTPGGYVLSPKPGAWDAGMVGYVFVIQSDVNGAYYMFYDGAEYTYGVDPTLATANIGLAISDQ